MTFRQAKIEPEKFDSFLIFGLVFTWIAGMGRYWDHPKAELWQLLGLGSLAYVFILALLLWLFALPLKPERWTYKNVLLFVTLTSPPAVLYAIPVERFMTLENAQLANIWFLIIVALWRVGLYANFLIRVAGLKIMSVIIGTLLPLALTVAALFALNLEHVVFNIMAGLNENESANDGAYGILFVITMLSLFASPVLLITYSFLIYRAHSKNKFYFENEK